MKNDFIPQITKQQGIQPCPPLCFFLQQAMTGRAHEVNHKLNAITCSTFKFSSHRTNPKLQSVEMTNIESSSSEDQEVEGDDDVCTELPMMNGAVLESLQKACNSQTKQDKGGNINSKQVIPATGGSEPNKKRLTLDYKMHLQVRQNSPRHKNWGENGLYF